MSGGGEKINAKRSTKKRSYAHYKEWDRKGKPHNKNVTPKTHPASHSQTGVGNDCR